MRSQYIIGSLVTVFATGFLLLRFGGPAEPSFEGRGLREWLEDLDAKNVAPESHDGGRAAVAVRELGTNAIPTLLRLLVARDCGMKRKVLDLCRKNPWRKKQITSDFTLHERAILGFECLGPVADSAVPSLTKLLQEPETAASAALALSAIGNAGKPALLFGLTNAPADARIATMFGIRPDKDFVEALIACLSDTSPKVRGDAALTLGMWGKQPSLVIPRLIERLGDTNRFVLICAVSALDDFGPAAIDAVPFLSPLLEFPDKEIRERATRALQGINP